MTTITHEQKAIALTIKIQAKAAALLAPLDTEMRMMNWKPEFRRIMWDAVLREVAKRLETP